MSIVRHAPRFAEHDAETLARTLFDIHGSATPLPSERDQNFLLRTATGAAYVLKIANAFESATMLDAQNQAMSHVASHGNNVHCQQVIRTVDDAAMAEVAGPDGRQHFVRMLTYLPGKPLALVKPHSATLLHNLGRCMGQLSRSLFGFDHAGAHREFHWDLAHASAVIRQFKGEIDETPRRNLVERLLIRFEAEAAPLLTGLRRAVIHGDPNDYNILAGSSHDLLQKNQQIVGILDFGDLVYSYVIGDLAIAAAYAILDKRDPLTAAAQVVGGYHAAHPLPEIEISVLWHLLCMRLCMSVCHSAHQRRQEPENNYLSISEGPAWTTLNRLAAIHPRLAHYTLRAACGLDACPHTAEVVSWLQQGSDRVSPVLDIDLRHAPVHVLDLSVGSPLITGEMIGADDVRLYTTAIDADIRRTGTSVGIGRYDEARPFYTDPTFILDGDLTGERRTVHLGVDLFVQPGTPVHAPLDGVVHALADNAARHDYGPTVLLRHTTTSGQHFFTLYGHLSRKSLDQLTEGQTLAAGTRIGRIGEPPDNGDWPPHLHLQIIADPLDLGCDFPGVASAHQRPVWLSLAPDPNLLLGIPQHRFPERAPGKAETLAERRQRLGPNLSISYRNPLKIVRGFRQYLYDDTGRAFLDAVNNVAHVGHCHPHVVAAGQRQMAVLNTNTRYLHDSVVAYARRLCATLPEPLSVCFFVNSGSEANDLALRLARTATGKQDVITVGVAYHGHTQALIEVSPYKHEGPGGQGRPAYVHKVVMPDPYRGPYRGYTQEAGHRYGETVRAAVDTIQSQGRGVAAFICESLMGCGGQIVFPEGYMAEAFHHVRGAGGICIADEVQVGFGRVGSHFWGFETQGVVPDIVTIGKPAGNGHPLAAVVTTPAIARRFANGMEYFNTFGGNPVSCEIGLAVLDVIEREQLQENALVTGRYLMAAAWELMRDHPIVGDVRGLGLYIGIELVLDRATLEPAGEHAAYVANRMRDHGVLISTDGPFHNVLKIKPPIIFSGADADLLVNRLADVLGEDACQVA